MQAHKEYHEELDRCRGREAEAALAPERPFSLTNASTAAEHQIEPSRDQPSTSTASLGAILKVP